MAANHFYALVIAMVILPTSAVAQSLTANPTTNNGSGGVFMQLTPTSLPLTLNSFSTFFSSTAGTPVSVEVWTRPGAYAGFTASNMGWTLTQTVVGTSAGTSTASAPIPLTNPIDLPAGSTTSVYVHAITTGGGIRYFGTGTTSNTNFSNADLDMFTNIARTGSLPFGGSQFTPRAFAGSIQYSVIPEPVLLGTLSILATGLVSVRRSRKA